MHIFFCFYREEEKSYSFIDRKYTVKQDLPSNSTINQTSHNRTMIPTNQWVESDSNPTSSQSTCSPSSMPDKKNYSADTACTQERNIELEAASHLLTPQEKSLCIQLDLEPTAYLTQKTMVIDVSM